MATIWVHKFKDICKSIKENDKDLYKLEMEHANKIIEEETLFHKELDKNL